MHENSNSEIMLLFRGTDWHRQMSPEEMQAAAGRFMAWFERLKAEGKAKAGQPLQNVGRVISKNGRTLSDGPYAESKEAIGGYFILNVTDLDEAVEIAKQCPGLDIGLQVEVRPVAARCAMAERAEEALAHAVA
ncbi:MAG TPA: YciI family protein [Verrucomicrobiae bacterium]|nr:YciI family protein [Verrucomicrobiae bacterium]